MASTRGSQGSGVGTCRVCNERVKSADQAWFHVDDITGEKWVEHLACHPRFDFNTSKGV